MCDVCCNKEELENWIEESGQLRKEADKAIAEAKEVFDIK